jgi:hypothetical protein
MAIPDRQCLATKPDGARCRTAVLPDSEFCFFHDPSKAAERREAQAQGGRQNRMKTLDVGAPDIKIESSGQIMTLLSDTISQVRKGSIDPRIANSIGYLANVAMRVLEQNDLEGRIEKLEQLLELRNPQLANRRS